MERKKVFDITGTGSAVLGSGTGITTDTWAVSVDKSEVVIERDMPKKPHTGKVFAAVCAHSKEIMKAIPDTSYGQVMMIRVVMGPYSRIS